MSLYSKYRPQNFANLVGQDHIRQTILSEIKQGSVSHAYLFAGPRGTGKTSTARLIAKAINCEKLTAASRAHGASAQAEAKEPERPRDERLSEAEHTIGAAPEPCDTCDFCTGIKDGSLIDVIEIDAASNRGIDEIRDLREKIKFAPTRAKSKTYIIDEVHMLTKEAFNALLKTLEEPPENVYFILCTTEIHKIPETIISRCQRFDFKRIDVKTLMTRLNYIAQMEGIEAEDAAIDLIARHVEGGLRDAIGLFEQMAISGKLVADHVRAHLGITGHQTIETLLQLLEKQDLTQALHLVNEVHREGYDLTTFTRELLECLRERLLKSITEESDKEAAAAALKAIEYFEEARDALRNTVIPQLPLEIAVIKICQQQSGPQNRTFAAANVAAKTPEQSEEKIKPLQETKEAQKEEEKTAATLKKEIEMEHYSGEIGKHWPRVMEHVQPPSLRRSLSDAKIQEGKDSEITLTFSSRFHMEKVNQVTSRAKIEKAIEHLFGKKLKVACVLDTSVSPMQALAETKKMPEKSSIEDLSKKAMEMFENE